MNNKLSGTISVADLGNQLKLLADKGPITKEGLRRGLYPLISVERYS